MLTQQDHLASVGLVALVLRVTAGSNNQTADPIEFSQALAQTVSTDAAIGSNLSGNVKIDGSY